MSDAVPPATVADHLRACLDDLSPAERLVARTLVADYPRAGLASAATLAKLAGVSAPTVVRFAVSAGYGGFADLQARLRDEVGARAHAQEWSDPWAGAWLKEPVPATPGLTHPPASPQDRAHLLSTQAAEAFARIPSDSWEATVAALADPRHRIHCLGGRYSGMAARQLMVALEMVRSGVSQVSDPWGAGASSLMDLRRRDVLVAFDLPRYQHSTVDACALARQRNALVILVTDPELSPATEHADICLPVSIASPSLFPTLTGATLLCDLLVIAVTERLGEAAVTRMRRWEAFRSRELVAESSPG